MKKEFSNLFIVSTTYQFICAMVMIEEWNKESENKSLIVFRTKENSLFQTETFVKTDSIEYKRFHYYDKQAFVDYCLSISVKRFIFSQEGDIHLLYLCKHFKKRGSTTYLSPDGAKYFAVYNKKHEFLSALKETYYAYKSLNFNQILLFGFRLLYNYRYGYFRYIDHVLAPNCGLPIGKNTKAVLMPRLTNDLLNRLSKQFQFKFAPITYDKAVLFFNQPLWTETMIVEETRQMMYLHQQFEHFYIKIHPSTPQKRIEFLEEKIGKIQVIKDNVPAEFYMAKFSNSVFVSGWSTCLMHELGENNRFYYTFAMFKKLKHPFLNQIHLLPFAHTQFTEDIENIKIQENVVE